LTGNQKGEIKTNSNLNVSPPKLALGSSLFNYFTFRYYKKLDWLLGILGGGIFLNYIGLILIFKFLNDFVS